MIFTQHLAGLGRMAAPASAALGTQWDAAQLGDGVVLSNGDLTAEAVAPGLYANARSTVGKTTGKWYFEVVLDTIGSSFMPGIGVCDFLPAASDDEFGQAAGGYEIRADGDKYFAGTLGSFASAFSAGDTVMVAFDMTAGKVWFGKNGTWLVSGDPAAGTGQASSGLTGTMRAAISCGPAGSEGKATAKFTGFTYTPPSGFSALA